ncbi:MAG TPA: hypothetical protein EYG80_00170, partial [Flavobacteriaceae bacterium]|nr:hypothetical protein [Flavobacteriaceae bacterium]
TIDENDDYIPDFFGENINVTAIVGKNGSGKSAILETLINDIIFNHKVDYKTQSLYCYLNDAKDEIYINSSLVTKDNIKSDFKYKMTHINSEDDITGYEGCMFQSQVKKLEIFTEEYNKSFFYFYNNNFEEDNHFRKNYVYNEELLFYQEIDKSNDTINLEIENSKIYIYLLELFLNQDRLSDEIKNLFIPTKIFLDRNVFTYFSKKEFELEENSYRDFIQNTSNIEEILKLETLIYLRHYINNNMLHHRWDEDINKLKEIFHSVNIVEDYDYMLDDIEYIFKKINNSIKFIKNDIRHDDNRNNDNDLENTSELEKIINVIKNTSLLAPLIKNVRNNPYYDYEVNSFYLNCDNIKELKTLPSYLAIDFANKRALRFSELSSGEQNILKLLFSIENIIHLREDKTDSFYILLDEIENTLHPDWQKKIIEWLTSFLRYHSDIQFNIIITSHSPFILSDLAKENIIFLKDGKQVKDIDKKQTFGANIHTLLSDSFFMEDGLMGEFAKSKINEIIDFHKKIEK